MKKILLIIFSLFLFLGINAQLYKTYKWQGTITLHAKNDTSYIWAELDKDFVIGVPWSLVLDHTTLSTSTVKVGIIGGESARLFNYLPTDTNTFTFPCLLDAEHYRNPMGRDSVRVTEFMSFVPILFPKLGLQIITADTVNGDINYYFLQRLYYK